MEDTELGATVTGRTRRQPGGRLPRGAALGRYLVTDVLGEGGMGVVYAAYDPELDRRLAIKLIHPARDAGASATTGRARLLREAQSLAKLQHPNAITVHDVGVHDEQVFVAMELVDGPTLGAWCQAQPRSATAVVDAFVAAGRGLQAAHDKGLVHRDFKPENVLLTLDPRTGAPARVVVLDFGLARTEAEAAPPTERDVTRSSEASMAASGELTRTGAVMGTPAYMAPEQHGGATLDGRSDQFSFCVALYEALYGQRPFAGASLPELVANVAAGRVLDAPAGAAVPRWLREVVVRGLAVDPAQRWPSVGALLEALRRDPTARRRRRVAVAAAAGTLAVVAVGALAREQARIADCHTAAAAIDTLWDDGARARIETALMATGAGHAPDVWQRLQARIDRHADAWRAARYASCAAPSPFERELATVQTECFDTAAQRLADLLELLAHADTAVLNRAIAMVPSAVLACRDEAQLRRDADARDDGDRARAAALRRQLVQARVLDTAGRYDEAIALAEATRDEAQQLGLPKLVAAAHDRVGYALNSAGRQAEAEVALEEAFFTAIAAGTDSVALNAATLLVAVTGGVLGRRADGLRWARHAERLAAAATAGGERPAMLDMNLGNIALTAGDYPLAVEHFERALAQRVREFGEHEPSSISALKALGATHDALGEHDEARRCLERALALGEEVFGAEHPEVAHLHNDLAAALLSERDYAGAQGHLSQAIASYEASGHEERLASALDNLSIAQFDSGQRDAALATSARALAIRERRLPPGHPQLGNSHLNYGAMLSELGRGAEAIEHLDRATEIYTATLGPEHERIGDVLFNRAEVLEALGQREAAREALVRSLAIRRAALAPTHAKVRDAADALAALEAELAASTKAR